MKRTLARRVGRILARVTAGLVLLALFLVMLVMLSMELPVVRDVVRQRANTELEKALQGRVTIGRLGKLGFSGVAGVDATVTDPAGQRVVSVQGLRVDAFWPRIVWSALTGTVIEIGLDTVHLDHAEVILRDDGSGAPTLAAAFAPKPKPKTPGPATDVRVHLGRIVWNHGWVHGRLGDGPPIDGEVRVVDARLASDARATTLTLTELRLSARALPENLNPSGTVVGRLHLPSGTGPRGSGRFAGVVAGFLVTAEGGWDGTNLRAQLRAPDVSGEPSQRLGLLLRDPTRLAVSADGKWPDIRFDGELTGPALKVAIQGQAHVAEEVRVVATVDARDADLSRIVRDAPTSSLSARAELSLRLPSSGPIDGKFRVDVPPGRVADLATPPLETEGWFSGSNDGELRVDGRATIAETGAPVEAAYRVVAKDGTVHAHGEVDARLRQPPRLVAFGVRASGTLRASADFDSRTSALDAKANLRLSSIEHQAVRAEAINVNAGVRGSTADPRLSADVTAGPIDAGGRRFRHLAVSASGKPSSLAVSAIVEGTNPERAEIETEVSLARGAELERLRVTLMGPEGPVELGASKVVVADGRVRVDGLALRGAGRADGRLDLAPGRERVEISAVDVDIGRLARLTGVRLPLEQAVVSSEVSLERRGTTLVGKLRASAREVQIGRLENASATVDLAFAPKDVSGTAEGDFGEGGRFRVELDRFELPREQWTLARFANQRGRLVACGDLRLSGFLPLVQAAGLPIERMAGTAEFDIDATGGGAERSGGPRVAARLQTKGLRLVERRARQERIRTVKHAREAEPRALEDVDLKVLLQIEPNEASRLNLELYDRHGTIVALNGESRLPDNWPATIGNSFRTLPLRANLTLPRRAFADFPALVRPAATKGILSAGVDLEGSIAAPVVDGEVALDALRARKGDEPLRVLLTTHYERARGTLSLVADARGRSVGQLEARWRGDAARLATARPNAKSPIELELQGELDAFPLGTIPALADRQVQGPLDGAFQLEGLGRNAKLDVSLDGSRMTIAGVRMERLRAVITAQGDRARVEVEGGDRSGNAELDLEASTAWGDRLAPNVPTRVEGRLLARKFRLETLSPALKRYLNEVAGRLDADLRVKLEAGKTDLSGEASLREGVVQVPAVGERFTDVTAKVQIADQRVLIQEMTARGPTGRLTVNASARLDGLSLKAAEAHVVVKENQKVPVALEGAALGDAWGRAAIVYRDTGGGTEIDIDVPSLHVEMPEQGDLEVQSLQDVESIRIGARLADGTFTSLPVQPLELGGEESEASSPLRVRVRLGKDVELERGRMLRVKLRGEVSMTSDGETKMTGRLELRGGKLDVQGKLFEIERGLVTFSGDASNPTITATARWDSPGGYAVYAEYVGDVRNGKITLHAEPPLSQDEIASLILFGDPEGSIGAGSGGVNSAGTAIGVAGSTAAKGINRALSDLTNLDVAARVDTSTGTARPELVVQLTPRVAARLTRAVGEPQAGQPPDRTFLTVEFRFTQRWSVSGVVGDHGGSGLDVIWRRRY